MIFVRDKVRLSDSANIFGNILNQCKISLGVLSDAYPSLQHLRGWVKMSSGLTWATYGVLGQREVQCESKSQNRQKEKTQMCDSPSERWTDLSGATERLAVYYSKLRSSIDDYSGLNCDLTFLSVSLKSYHITMWMWLSYHEKFKVSKLPWSPIPTWQVSLWRMSQAEGLCGHSDDLGKRQWGDGRGQSSETSEKPALPLPWCQTSNLLSCETSHFFSS